MAAFIGILVAIVAIFLSIQWWNKRQQKLTAEATASKAKEEERDLKQKQQEQQQKQNQQPKKPDKKKKKVQSTTRTKNKHQIPSHPRFLRRYGGHSGAITSFAVSPDGTWLATSGADGQVRVSKVDEPGFSLSCTVKTPGMGVFQDHISAISWLNSSGNPTLVGTIDKSRQMAFYRIRHKKNATTTSSSNSANQYEVIELIKRRFDISSKIDENVRIDTCLVDQSRDDDDSSLIFTKTEYDPKDKSSKNPNVVAWDGNATAGSHHDLSGTITNSLGIRTSPDGNFLSSRGGGIDTESKIFEVRHKKVKGSSTPVFDSLSSKSVMTLVPKTTKSKIADAAFIGESDIVKLHHANLGVVATEDGTIEVWDLDVDFRNKEDPKFVCDVRLFDDQEMKVVRMASSVAVPKNGKGNDDGGAVYRIAVATDDSALHLLSYDVRNGQLSIDYTIDNSHKEGVGELLFCPSEGNILYTTGTRNLGRDVYSWKIC